MAKRGRPKNTETQLWEKKYYKLSTMADNKAIKKVREERLINAYNEVYKLAFGVPMTWKQTKEIQSLLYLE